MTTAIYIMSSDDNKSNQDLLAPLVQRVKSEGSQYKIFAEILDKNGNQSLKKELLARVQDKEFDIILVYRLSDWSSSLLRLSSELREMDLKRIRFISYYENFDSFSLTGKLYSHVLITMSECEPSIDAGISQIENNKLKSEDHRLQGHKRKERINSLERPAGLNDLGLNVSVEERDNSVSSFIPKEKSGSGKDTAKTEPFDLVGIDEACFLTGYSKNTLYQFTSRKLIPHFKRPHGRRIFFSKRSLEEWILTGKI